MRPEGLCQWQIPMTPSEIEPATSQLVAQCLNQLRHRAPLLQTATLLQLKMHTLPALYSRVMFQDHLRKVKNCEKLTLPPPKHTVFVYVNVFRSFPETLSHLRKVKNCEKLTLPPPNTLFLYMLMFFVPFQKHCLTCEK